MLWDSRSYWNLLSSLIWGQCSARESSVTLHLVSADTEVGGAPCYRRARAEAAVLTPHEASTGTLLAWQRGSALFQLSTWSLLTPQWGGSLVTVNIKVLSLHQATASQIPEGRGEGASWLLVGMKSQLPAGRQWSWGALVTASWRWKSGLAPQSFQAWVWMIPQFFLWCLARVEAAIHTFSILLGCPFPGPLARESWLLLGLFWSVHTDISGFSSSSAPSGHI